MAELTVETGPLRGQTLMFSESEPLVVGRADDCTLRLDGPGIADRHLVIKALKSGGFGVKKLEASFLLNGQATEAARLKEGDLLELGGFRLRFGPPQLNGAEGPKLVIAGFSLNGILGKGGHGTVYRAEQLSLHREIALKVLNTDMTKNPEFVGRFVAEARAAARLSHPNVVHVFDVGHDDDTYYLSMEIMELGSLEDRLRAEGRMPVEDCLGAMIDAAKGLAYAESMRIVHRDIKPDNIMVDGHGVAKIADLGLAMSDDAEQGKIVGTPHFMSPEQVLNKPLDHRSDLYSLGCTFFRLATGRTLFQARTTKEILTAHVKREPESADAVHDAVPATVAAIINRLVEKDPDDRFQSAAELIEELEAVLHPPARKGLLIGIIAALVLGTSYAIYWGLTRPKGGNGLTKIVEVTNPRVLKELRETKALAEFRTINLRSLLPLELATSLEAFSRHKDYTGTKAAVDAVAKAKDLRVDEAERVRLETARTAAVNTATTKIRTRVQKWIDDGKFKEAAAGLQPTDFPEDVLRDQRIQAVLSTLRANLVVAGSAQLDRWKASIEKGRSDRDPEAMAQALAHLDEVLDGDKPKGWPSWVFADRLNETTYAKGIREDIEQLRSELMSSRDSSAWASFRRQTLGKDGILAKMAGFDTAGALTLATKTAQALQPFEAGRRAKQVLAVVTAAKAYEDAYRQAITAGNVSIPVTVNGAVTDVPVHAFVSSGEGAGVAVEIPTGDHQARTIPLSELRGRRLFEVFVAVGTAGGTQDTNRLAFLALHALHEHLTAAKEYMAKIDPDVATSGTGDDRFTAAVSTLTTLTKSLNGVAPPWGDFLSKEIRAMRELSRGLRAFSNQQYTQAHGYLEKLEARYDSTFAVMTVR